MKALDVKVVGGGPAGLYAALLLKRLNPEHRVAVYERNPQGATYGWGVVLSDRTLTAFAEADARTYEEISRHQIRWETVEVRYGGETIRSGGHRYLGIGRHRLLDILRLRCDELGVELHFSTELNDFDDFGDHDLVLAADGVNSGIREQYSGAFGPSFRWGDLRYIWLGVEYPLETFPFIFESRGDGLFQCHAYPFDGHMTTAVVMCNEETWLKAGLDQAAESDSVDYCNGLFSRHFGGRPFIANKAAWYRFPTIATKSWSHDNIALIGDSAHTAHFTIGSGTKLAMEDAIALVGALERSPSVQAALADYELERRPVVEAFQQAGIESESYCEEISRYVDFDPPQFAFNLLVRSGRIDYDNLRLRDEFFVESVDAWYQHRSRAQATGSTSGSADIGVRARWRVAVPPLATPLRLRRVVALNRVAVAAPSADAAADATATDAHVDAMRSLAATGAGVVITEFLAVKAEGRITPVTPGLYEDSHATAWERVLSQAREAGPTGQLFAAVVGHAGRRGAMRPRAQGLDRPLSDRAAWPLLAPSAIPYTPGGRVPAEMTDADLVKVRDAYARAAQLAAAAGFDALLLHMAHGYLLGSFLSPLSNRREDGYGGPLENRMRLPLEVFEDIRAGWPDDRPVVAIVPGSDLVAGGFDPHDAVRFARELRSRGCDMVQPLSGQATPDYSPAFSPAFLAGCGDQLRNEAQIEVLLAGGITRMSQVNTLLAAGRADMCVLNRSWVG